MKANQCMECGKFSKYEDMDSYIPFGCPNPASPEPYDPTQLCGNCSEKLYEEFKQKFKVGIFHGHWQKSDAEIKAARECKLKWIHSNSIEIDGKRILYQWVKKSSLTTPKVEGGKG